MVDMETIEAGDVVVLMSGGPPMTIVKISQDDSTVEALWYCMGTGDYKRMRFVQGAIRLWTQDDQVNAQGDGCCIHDDGDDEDD